MCVMITIGIKGREEAVVLPELTAKHIGSGTVPVLATPMMIALMEKTCRLHEIVPDQSETLFLTRTVWMTTEIRIREMPSQKDQPSSRNSPNSTAANAML